MPSNSYYSVLILSFLSSYWWAIVIICLLVAILVVLCRVRSILFDMFDKDNSNNDELDTE